MISTFHLLITAFGFNSLTYAQQALVHPNHPSATIAQNELRSIFSMRTRVWPNGTPITVYILDLDSKTHREFCLNKLEIFPYQLRRVWDVLVYSGTGQSPIEVNSEAEMLKEIARTPGAIGYISDVGVPDNVKIIDVQK